MRIGSRLLAQFEYFAVEKGYGEVRLYTNNLNTSHMKFIRQHGYEIIQCVSRTLMRGSLVQWKKRLRLSPDEEEQPTTVIPTSATPSTTLQPPTTTGIEPLVPGGQEVSKRISSTVVVMD